MQWQRLVGRDVLPAPLASPCAFHAVLCTACDAPLPLTAHGTPPPPIQCWITSRCMYFAWLLRIPFLERAACVCCCPGDCALCVCHATLEHCAALLLAAASHAWQCNLCKRFDYARVSLVLICRSIQGVNTALTAQHGSYTHLTLPPTRESTTADTALEVKHNKIEYDTSCTANIAAR